MTITNCTLKNCEVNSNGICSTTNEVLCDSIPYQFQPPEMRHGGMEVERLKKSVGALERSDEVMKVEDGWVYYKDGTKKKIEDEPELNKYLKLEK